MMYDYQGMYCSMYKHIWYVKNMVKRKSMVKLTCKYVKIMTSSVYVMYANQLSMCIITHHLDLQLTIVRAADTDNNIKL